MELCCALGEDGLTPSAGFLEQSQQIDIVRNVLIRPRGGNFVYSDDELRLMEADIRFAHKMGAHGIVTGALKTTGEIDTEAMRRLIDAADGLPVTFHRAIDQCRCIREDAKTVVELGCKRLLTSGTAGTALVGIPLLKCMQKEWGDDLEIIAAGNVRPDNVVRIVSETGVAAFHSSASTEIIVSSPDGADHCKSSPALRTTFCHRQTDAAIVSQLRHLLDTME